MSFLSRLLYPMLHCEDATAFLLSSLNLKYTRSYLRKELRQHPNYPTMLSIADVIGSCYNVSCIPLQYNRDEIFAEPEVQPPFVAHIKSGQAGKVFAVVTKFSNDSIELYNPDSKKTEILSPKAFDGVYLGTLLMARGDENAGEKDYEKNFKQEKQRLNLCSIIAFALPVLTFITCLITAILDPSTKVIAPIIFVLLALSGTAVSALLVWHEVDEYNPALKQICQSGRKVNCSAILHSKGSKIFGLSWSSIGVCYFGGMQMTLLTSGIDNLSTLQLLSWINVLALPYIGFSIYYQWKIAKQWCLLCLFVQGLFLLQFFTAFIGGFHTLVTLQQVPIQAYLTIVATFAFLFTAILLLTPALQSAKEGRQTKVEMQRLKNNYQVFEALLNKQKTIDEPPDDLGIILGNPDGVYKLIKVCNPYCGPCSQAHPAMEELVENNDEICLQVVFTATEDDNDIKKFPVSHFLSIETKKDQKLLRKALGDWYNMPLKNYTEFAIKYPLNGELKQQDKKIKMMREWCDETEIAYTPTYFLCLNTSTEEMKFHQLPEMYSVNDLKYFLSI